MMNMGLVVIVYYWRWCWICWSSYWAVLL